jgi:hypothetical protein
MLTSRVFAIQSIFVNESESFSFCAKDFAVEIWCLLQQNAIFNNFLLIFFVASFVNQNQEKKRHYSAAFPYSSYVPTRDSC